MKEVLLGSFVAVMLEFTVPHANVPPKQVTDHVLQESSSLNPKSFTARDLCGWFKDTRSLLE